MTLFLQNSLKPLYYLNFKKLAYKKSLEKTFTLYIICLGGDKMQLKKNEIKIIQLLLASDNYISSYEIANSTGISRRRVRDEMKIVKDILATLHLNLLSKPSQGYYIEGKSSQDLTELQSIINKNERDDDSLIPSLPDERSNYILGRLINSREFIKLETLADELLVSRATIANDLVSIKNEFKKYGLKFNQKPN